MKINTPRLLIAILAVCLFPMTVAAQPSHDRSSDKAYARAPKEIAFQNDDHWEDNRWRQSDIGPFLAGTIVTGGQTTLKGIAIRIGNNGQAAVCFDTARMRTSAAWTDDFLDFGSRRFGLIRPPRAAGELIFETEAIAGWAQDGRFKPEPHEITNPDIKGYKPGSSETHLPKDWAHYKGLFTSGSRVVLSYTVGSTDVLESPWYVQSEEHEAFVRSLEVGPSPTTLHMWGGGGADTDSQVIIVDAESKQPSLTQRRLDDRAGSVDEIARLAEDRTVLIIPPHKNTVRVKLLSTRMDASGDAIASLRHAAGNVENLSQMIADDKGRYPEVLTTAGTTTESGGPYVIDTLTLPFENPWNALFFTAGHDFFPDGSAALCTIHGDVWTVRGIDRQLGKLSWRRFATGLCQPLGLKIVDGKVYVIGRNQMTRLHDTNGDGEADYYENFNNDAIIAPRSHDFVTCLDTDPEGNFYFIHAHTGVMRVSADGSELTAVADGFRNPNGMAVGPDGTITVAPQQGTWTPESSLIVVKEGGYYGYGGPRITDDRPTGWDRPMCFIPRSMDNSGGAQVWVEGDRWGPLAGQMLHLSYGQCRMLLALTERVDGVYQGGAIKFPTTPADFESGIMRGRFNPHDGQLYVSGLRGWQTRSIRDGCFQRVRYTGGPLHLPVAVKTFRNGIEMTFSEPLDPELAKNPDNFFVEQWNYLWSEEYGSPDFSVKNPSQPGRDEVPVVSSTLLNDGHSVFLEMPNRRPVMQLSVSWLLGSTGGHHFRGTYAHTINSEPRDMFPESQIIRRDRPQRVAFDVQGRLKPGLEFRFRTTTSKKVDSRVSRLAVLEQPVNRPTTPFLPPERFGLTINGMLRMPLSGFFDFSLEGAGEAQLRINDDSIVSLGTKTAEPLLLHKGHNRLQINYSSPPTGHAQLRLLWRGYNFDWEPVPPDVLFHDSGSAELITAHQRRLGRELFGNHRCAQCHQTNVGQQPMFELSLAAPDLSAAGDRFTAAWLQQWLVSPVSLRPDTRMPAVVGSGSQAWRDAADIAGYLLSSRTNTDATATTTTADGESLFETLGCINCHHFAAPDSHDEWERMSLYFVHSKFRPGALTEFLRDPTKHHSATTMPDYQLTLEESEALARFVRSKSTGKPAAPFADADVQRGGRLFAERGCRQCHSIGVETPTAPAELRWKRPVERSGCLDRDMSLRKVGTPDFAFSEAEQNALLVFLRHDLHSLQHSSPVETSDRLVKRLKCGNCHDRDGRRSPRLTLAAEEGSGKVPDPLPALTWAGEKLQPSWTERLLGGKIAYKSRPWIKARMPVFQAYASALAHGLAAEHGIDSLEPPGHSFNPDLAATGKLLTRQTALDCRQCHAIGEQQPRGDKETKIALGINFSYIRDRLRRDSYHRFMLDPPRYDINSRMIRLSADGRTTKLKEYFDSDARQQFDAVWHYMQSLPDASELQ